MNKLTTKALTWIDALTVYEDERQSSSLYYDESDADITVPDLKALATAFRTLHDCALKYANEDAWTGQFSKDGRQDLWLYGEGKATAVQALKSLGDIVN